MKIGKHRPLSKHALEQLKEYYRIGFTYTSNACIPAMQKNEIVESAGISMYNMGDGCNIQQSLMWLAYMFHFKGEQNISN